jgi:hypothetical protein
MPTRCFWPPDNWRGIRSAKARGSFTRSSSSSIRWWRSASDLPYLKISSARMIWRPTFIEGFSVSNGFWNTICTEDTVSVLRFWIGVDCTFSSNSMIEPEVAVSSPISTLAKVDLPQPDSPTMASVSPSRASKDRVSLALTTFFMPPPKAPPETE